MYTQHRKEFVLKINTVPTDLKEGLFGQIVLWVLEILPDLQERNEFPDWHITSEIYGTAPDYKVVPGVFDLAYTPDKKQAIKPINLITLRHIYNSVFGGDWRYAHQLWHTYFKIPDAVKVEAEAIALPPNTLGIHYRGNDKNKAAWDTNPVSHSDFLLLTQDFLDRHPDVKTVFVATDEFSFAISAHEKLAARNVINLGETGFHKRSRNVPGKASRALLDCLLLSQCRYVIKCSSAMSGFAKVLNPELECYRVSASKLFADVPYFPDAYIPRLTSPNPACQAVLERLFAGDWLDNAVARSRFYPAFGSRPHYTGLKKMRHQASFLLSQWLSKQQA